MIDDKAIMIKGELHYYMPHRFPGGNSAACWRCRYFVQDEKTKDPRINTGECHSKAHQTERGYSHRNSGWDKTADIFGCKWWFPIEKQEGENYALGIECEKV